MVLSRDFFYICQSSSQNSRNNVIPLGYDDPSMVHLFVQPEDDIVFENMNNSDQDEEETVRRPKKQKRPKRKALKSQKSRCQAVSSSYSVSYQCPKSCQCYPYIGDRSFYQE